MIDERQEELASLYALDLLEGAECAQFEAALAHDPALQDLVRNLRESSTALARAATGPATPTALKRRLMATIRMRDVVPERRAVILIPHRAVSWTLAAGFALLGLWLGQRALVARSELALARNEQALVDVALRAARQALEAERIVARRQLDSAGTQLRTANAQLTQARQELAGRDRQMAALSQRFEALAVSSAQISRQLGETRERATELAAELRAQGNIVEFKIAPLSSTLDNSPEAIAVAVWNPAKQEGLFALEKAPALEPGQKLELWVMEAREGAAPVSAGALKVNPDGSAKARFKPGAPVGAVAKFAVSREQNDGVQFHSQPAEVVMIGASR